MVFVPMVLAAAFGWGGTALQEPEKVQPKYDMKLIQLVFLTAKPDAPALSAEEERGKQFEHLKYLESLWEQRKALLVGPLKDAGHWRGLVLFDFTDRAEAERLMSEDPWVKAGQMGFETHAWFVARNVPQKAPKFLDIEQYWFGTLTRPKDAPEVNEEEGKVLQQGHMANIVRMADQGALVLAGPMGGDGDFRGIFIFRGLPKETIEAMAAQDPAIQRGRLQLKLYPWFTAKGTFPQK